MNGGGDRISDLPELVLHKIRAFLPADDWARTSVLSKLWNSTHKSDPELVFIQKYHLKHVADDAPEFQQRLEDFLNYIDDSMRTHSERNLRVEKLLLKLHSVHSDAIPRIDDWLSFALRSGVVFLLFKVALRGDSPYYPLPQNMFSASVFCCLVRLTLEQVVMSETMIRDMARNCPNISTLTLCDIDGVKSVEISELYKLESFKIVSTRSRKAIKRISVSASNLKIFKCADCLSCDIDIASSPSLECLYLAYSSVTDYKLNLLISRFSLLETLDLAYCDELRTVRIISLPRLKSLTIKAGFHLIKSICVDAPALSSLKYTASAERFPLFSLENVPGAGVDYEVDLRVENATVDIYWFVELRKFLAGLSRITNLKISFSNNMYNTPISFYHQAAIVQAENLTLAEVDCLKFKSCDIMYASCSRAILEGFAWSCRPKNLSFFSDSNYKDIIVWSNVLVFKQKLERTKQNCSCYCDNIHFKCWHHDDLRAWNTNFNTSLRPRIPTFFLEWNFDPNSQR